MAISLNDQIKIEEPVPQIAAVGKEAFVTSN